MHKQPYFIPFFFFRKKYIIKKFKSAYHRQLLWKRLKNLVILPITLAPIHQIFYINFSYLQFSNLKLGNILSFIQAITSPNLILNLQLFRYIKRYINNKRKKILNTLIAETVLLYSGLYSNKRIRISKIVTKNNKIGTK